MNMPALGDEEEFIRRGREMWIGCSSWLWN